MPKTVYVHIGAHKTGSTAIQAYFSGHRQDFLASGLLYPVAGIPPNLHGHHYVPWLFRRQKDLSSLAADSISALKREIRDSVVDSVLISSEEMENQRCPTNKIAKELNLDRYSSVIVLFIRRQDDLIASAYASQLKQGRHIASLKDFVEAQLERRRGDFYALLMAWRRVLPDVNIKIVNYSDPLVASDAVRVMCEALGVAIPVKTNVTSKNNVSIHPTYLPFLNFLNRDAAGRSKNRRKEIVEPLLELSALARKGRVRHYIIEPMLRARIMEAFQESNAMLADEFIGGVPPFSFNKSEYEGAVHVDPDTVSLSSIVESCRALDEISTDRTG